MARARASLAISEPEFDEAWPEDGATARRVAPRLVAAPDEPMSASDEPMSARDELASARDELGAPRDELTSARHELTDASYEPTGSPAVPRGTAVPGRRTVTIRGQLASRPAPRRPRRDPYDRVGSRPDRIAMWAVVLCLLLVLVAATSSHAAVLHVALHAHP